MNTATNAPTQGGKPSWQLISIADSLSDLNQEHAFLQALYQIAMEDPDSMSADLLHLLSAYLDTEPRQKLQDLSDQLVTIAKSISDRR
ncbi:MAG TPA: hypothetical protein VFM18_06940 [Methanosarcina sp.]|nr:hypothetical protein [Methanosarcina sp.]